MTDTLDMHAASAEETAAAHRNVFDIWSQGRALDDHVRFRLTSPKHRLATWYVGCVEGRVVVSLGAYPLRFQVRGRQVAGIAIGSVFTLSEFRRHGFAARLIPWVEEQIRDQGGALSMLYSDIKPDYYARLGYVLCPSLEGWCNPNETPVADLPHRLIEIEAAGHLDQLANLYSAYHGATPLSIARNKDYWEQLLQRFIDDRFFALADAHNNWKGYVRLGRKGTTMRITDFALAEQDEMLAEQLYGSCLALARENGVDRFGGWLPDSPASRRFFGLQSRSTEITMIKSLSTEYPLDDELIAATDRFCEIDHV